MKGWRYQSYRHSLAAKGIRTSFRLKYGKDIPIQLHTGSKQFRDVESVKGYLPFKPRGGFWTSSYREDMEPAERSEWLAWSSSNMPDKTSGEHIVVSIKPDAKVFEINDEEDIRFLFDKYGIMQYGMPDVDWSKIAQDYDGVRVTEQAASRFHNRQVSVDDLIQKKGLNPNSRTGIRPPLGSSVLGLTPFGGGIHLNAWDAESTIWFRDVFIKKTPLDMKIPNSRL